MIKEKLKKGMRRITALLLMSSMLFSVTTETQAMMYNYYGRYSFYSSNRTYCTVKVYKDFYTYYTIYSGTASVSTGFEYKANCKSAIVIEQTRKMSLDSQTVASINAGVDLSKYNIPAKIGGSIEKTTATSWDVANTVIRTIAASEPVGYYSYNVLLNKMHLRLDLFHNGIYQGRAYISAPISEPYRAIVYSEDGNYYNATKYY